jgi:hypothetical protein
MNTSDYQLKEEINDKFRMFQIHHITFPNEVRNVILQLVKTNKLFILATPEEIKNGSYGISAHSSNIII